VSLAIRTWPHGFIPKFQKRSGRNAKCQLRAASSTTVMLHRPQLSRTTSRRCRSQQGYILLSLLLVIALLAIFAASVERSITHQIKRDREQELIHRGVQYSRAVRHYYKKFGKYPTRIEDLESSNTLRFLRKRYKDPITGKDFKLLHQGEVQMSFGAGLMGGGAALNALAKNAGITAQNGQTIGAAVAAAALGQPGAPTSPMGANPADADSAGDDADSKATAQTGPGASPGSSPFGSDKINGQAFGGGAIVGVVSTSKDASIRSFNKKDHYNQWQFIYDPSTDRGGLLTTPNQPPLNIAGQAGTGQAGNGQPAAGMNGGLGGMNSQPAPPVTPAPAQPPEPDNP